MLLDKKTRAVAYWIYVGIAMLIVQVLLGGITRLTGSGLSITEWKPIMGTLPPLNDAAWQEAFKAYQNIAQYKYLNQHFNISDFKFIFFWEWFHRLWARLIGVVFLIPFLYFLVKGYFKRWMVAPLIILFLLGALQGAIGWIMVKSGLNDSDVYVNHIRLAAHFIAAMVLIGYALVFALKLTTDKKDLVAGNTLKTGGYIAIILTVIQLTYGAFMAGLKAAIAAPTWPDINGSMIPDSFLTQGSFINDVVQNKFSIHFIHRTLAYIICIVILWWWFKAKNIAYSKKFNRAKHMLIGLIVLQIVLGIFTVLHGNKITMGSFGAFEWLALMHQLTGMLLFLNLVAILFLVRRKVVVKS